MSARRACASVCSHPGQCIPLLSGLQTVHDGNTAACSPTEANAHVMAALDGMACRDNVHFARTNPCSKIRLAALDCKNHRLSLVLAFPVSFSLSLLTRLRLFLLFLLYPALLSTPILLFYYSSAYRGTNPRLHTCSTK